MTKQTNYQSRDEYFNMYEGIVWEKISKDIDSLEYDVGLYRYNNLDISDSVTQADLKKIIKAITLDHLTGEKKEEATEVKAGLKQITEKTAKIYKTKGRQTTLKKHLVEVVKKDLINDYGILNIIFDSEYWEEVANIMDDLEMWTNYLQPKRWDKEMAYKCNLIPFRYTSDYSELKLLALGGCGMDLSPKWDAYQVLTSGTIDKYSKLFSQRSYFEYVIGKELTKEVEKLITSNK